MTALVYTEEWWMQGDPPNCSLSGQKLAARLGMEPGNTRRRIRLGKTKYPELPWYTDWRQNGNDAFPVASMKDTSTLAKFMTRGRTLPELAAQGIAVDELRAIEGHDLFESRNHHNELVYLLLPEMRTAHKPLEPVWTHRWAVDEEGDMQPYIMIQMPDLDHDKLKIVPMADVHHGAAASFSSKFQEYVQWVASRDDVFAIINGDLFENAHGDSNHGVSIYEQDTRPKTQVEQMYEILCPIAHKILWMHPGNHEDRSRTRDFDPMELLCSKLNVPYCYEPVYADVCWRGNVFSFHAKHGNTSSQTKGGKMNAAARPQKFQDFTMFTLMSHVHDGDVSKNVRICRDRVNFQLVFKKQYIIITPSFYKYFGSYASKFGLEPGSTGAINIDLFANGDYHANS